MLFLFYYYLCPTMNYTQALQTINALPMFQNMGGSAYIPSLDNIKALSELLGNPHTHYPTIHIAGTNGKGSTAHMTASVLQEAGYKVGLYTSPHMTDLRERVRINGELVKEEILAELMTQIEDYMNRRKVSFFEVTTILAFYAFSREKVDVAIIETGLGGLWDSTNIITPLVSVITNISFDHCAILGNTYREIAFQKGGIIKPDTPVVIGEHNRECDSVFLEIAGKNNSPLIFAEEHFSVKEQDGLFIVAGNEEMAIGGELRGSYQKKNIATVLSTLEILSAHFTITRENKIQGITNAATNTGLRGRWQILGQRPLTVCDTGHNAGGITYIAEQINKTPHERLLIVFGVMADKAVEDILKILPAEAEYFFCHTAGARAMDCQTLQKRAAALGRKGRAIGEDGSSSVLEAFRAALSAAGPNDLIYIGGSTFIVADLLTNYEWLKNSGFSIT